MEEEEYSDPQEVFDDLTLSLKQDQQTMLSMVLYESFRNRQDMTKMDAAHKAASITGRFSPVLNAVVYLGFAERTVRRYRKEFF